MSTGDPNQESPGSEATAQNWSFSELPGSTEVYSATTNEWGARRGGDVGRVSLVGLSGRVGSVLKSSRRQRAAWSFLARLSGAEFANRISPQSRHTGPFRASQQASRAWVDGRIASVDAREYGAAVTAAYSRNLVFPVLRIPGFEEYLRPLDEAVRSAAKGEGEASELLQQVAVEWEKITETRGRDEQRDAYCRNLGVDP